MGRTLKVVEMTINGHPYVCPECAAAAFTLDATGFLDGLPASGNCPSCGHFWQDPLITCAALRQIRASSSGRERATDTDTFEITVGGAVLAGTLHPEVTADDLKQAGRVYWRRIAKPAVRRKKREVVRAVKRPIRAAKKAASGRVDEAVATAKAAAVGAAWSLQTGEPDPDCAPEPVNPCGACRGKGKFKIDSHLHDATTVRCSVCFGTGEID